MTGGNMALTQSLKDLAVPFGLVLAKTGFQAWRNNKDKKSTKKSAAKPAAKKSTSTRRKAAVGGSANMDLSEKFVDVFQNIQKYVENLQTRA